MVQLLSNSGLSNHVCCLPLRAAVLERMPVMDKNSPGHTNGDTSDEIKEPDPSKPKLIEAGLLSEPASQVIII